MVQGRVLVGGIVASYSINRMAVMIWLRICRVVLNPSVGSDQFIILLACAANT